MTNEDIAALVATLPAGIRSAVEQQDDEAFQIAFSGLTEEEQLRVAQVFQQLQASMASNLLADFEEDDLPSADELLATLPPPIFAAMQAEDAEGLQAAYEALDPETQERVGRTMMLLQALAERARQNETEFTAGAGDVLAAFETLLDAIVEVTLDPALPRFEIESTLAELEGKGWNLRGATERIWAGERDAARLTDGLDEHDTTLVMYVLEALQATE
jgi:hypothetical protein